MVNSRRLAVLPLLAAAASALSGDSTCKPTIKKLSADPTPEMMYYKNGILKANLPAECITEKRAFESALAVAVEREQCYLTTKERFLKKGDIVTVEVANHSIKDLKSLVENPLYYDRKMLIVAPKNANPSDVKKVKDCFDDRQPSTLEQYMDAIYLTGPEVPKFDRALYSMMAPKYHHKTSKINKVPVEILEVAIKNDPTLEKSQKDFILKMINNYKDKDNTIQDKKNNNSFTDALFKAINSITDKCENDIVLVKSFSEGEGSSYHQQMWDLSPVANFTNDYDPKPEL